MPPTLSPLEAELTKIFKQWSKLDLEDSPLVDLELFKQAIDSGAKNAREATQRVIQKALTDLGRQDPTAEILLRRRFLERVSMAALADELHISSATGYRRQHQAISRLASLLEESVTASEVTVGRRHWNADDQALILPPDIPLIGVQAPLDQLSERLLTQGPSWIIAIEGLGGIGKTAMASALVRQPAMGHCFSGLVWISARPENLFTAPQFSTGKVPVLTPDSLIEMLLARLDPAAPPDLPSVVKQQSLCDLLKAAPYLIVIDNLETVVDYEVLLPLLRRLAQPSKFLLTSRHRLQNQPDVHSLTLQGLSKEEAFNFVLHEADLRGLTLFTQDLTVEFEEIHEVVGGHPLALKLVIGQTSILPLSQVLDNLKQAEGKEADDLYTHIYWQAWHLLAPISQQLLVRMPLIHQGTFKQLLASSKLSPSLLQQAIADLAQLSLLQIAGTVQERRYSIHPLTETFLMNKVIQWSNQV